jgi:hypothetical protein
MSTFGTHELFTLASTVTFVSGESFHVSNVDVGNPTFSEGLYLLPEQQAWDNAWELKSHLMVVIHTSRDEVLASTYLTVQEYGVGPSLEAAIQDLLTSLSDYYQSLESREERLGPPGKEDLERLRALIGRQPLR